MKVSGPNVGKASTAAADRTGANKKLEKGTTPEAALAPTGANRSGSAERVNLSQRVQDMQRIRQIASEGVNDIDEAKVARLQAMIDSGEYKVDADAIADRLVDEHLNTPTS